MFAEFVVEYLAGGGHFRFEQILDQRQAAATTSACAGAFLDLIDAGQVVFLNRLADLSFADIVARTDLSIVVHIQSGPYGETAPATDQQRPGSHGQRITVLGEHGQLRVLGCVTDHNATDEMCPLGVEEQLLVDALKGVFKRDGSRFRGLFVIAKTGHVDAH